VPTLEDIGRRAVLVSALRLEIQAARCEADANGEEWCKEGDEPCAACIERYRLCYKLRRARQRLSAAISRMRYAPPAAVAFPGGVEYKVSYKRVGLDARRKKFARLASAERFIALLGPEPWLVLGKDPDDFQCCPGNECGCGGATVRESDAAYREGMPDLEYVRLERRTVGPWEPNRLPKRWTEWTPSSPSVATPAKPVFGERVRNTMAGDGNPQRDGMYVRTIRRTGRLNHGTWYEITDGKGAFWQSRPENTLFLGSKP
jgi:hypothetical protein